MTYFTLLFQYLSESPKAVLLKLGAEAPQGEA
jgi:hypothetical protein